MLTPSIRPVVRSVRVLGAVAGFSNFFPQLEQARRSTSDAVSVALHFGQKFWLADAAV
jgi:hypothetical protein